MKYIIAAVLMASTAYSQSVPQTVDLGPKIPPPSMRSNQQFGPSSAGNQYAAPGNRAGAGAQNQQNVIFEPPPPVVVDGKKASEMNEDEVREFLEKKIQTIYQDEGAVELLRVAPGYALTLTFDTPVSAVVLGDDQLVSFQMQGNTLVLSARQRAGDTSMQLLFGGQKIFNYHIFIAENYVDAQSTIRVISGGSDGAGSRNPYASPEGELDLKAIANIIANYDVLEQEKAINTRSVQRLPVFRKSDITSFEIYYIYVFKNGPIAISFAYTNPFTYPIKYDESRLRVQIGNMQFVPDFVSFHNSDLRPGQVTTGYLVLANAPFSLKQPFELIWK